ncbi:hypothetical protein WAF17_18275 [Bernardetia sp. ABR2-2B]|uniref:hypothetical protein n=1 Tax=Bernardetia sp. ABR2-2B TaxID=3127472 RepID=UPI0030CD68C4
MYHNDKNITQEIITNSENETVKLNKDNKDWKQLFYQRIFPQNIEAYKKINPKIIINHKPKKVANKTDKAIDFLINQEAISFNYDPHSMFIDDFKKAFESISVLIKNKEIKELEKLLYTVSVEGKTLAAGALLYLQKNKKIEFSKEAQERVNYILENEKKVYFSTEYCDFGNINYWFLAKDFEELFEKYGTEISKKNISNDTSEK